MPRGVYRSIHLCIRYIDVSNTRSYRLLSGSRGRLYRPAPQTLNDYRRRSSDIASLLSGIGTLYLLFALVIISHILQVGIVIMSAALGAGAVLLARLAGAGVRDDVPDADLPVTYLSPAERLAVDLAEEPSERVPAQRPATTTDTGAERMPEHAGA